MAEQRLIDANALDTDLCEEYLLQGDTATVLTAAGMQIYNSGIDIARARLREQPAIATAPSWISVEERLPGSDCDWVLAIGKFVPENTYGKPIISELRKDGKWWGDINDEFPLEDMGIRITHWMPLPEPPKEAE